MGVCLLIGSLADAAHFTSFISCPVNRCVYTGTLIIIKITISIQKQSQLLLAFERRIYFLVCECMNFFWGGGYFVSVIFLKILIGSKCNEGALFTNLNKKKCKFRCTNIPALGILCKI